MLVYDHFDTKPLILHGNSKPKELGSLPVEIQLDSDGGLVTIWEAFPRDVLRASSGYVDLALKPPKHQPYLEINSVVFPKGTVAADAVTRILAHVNKVGKVSEAYQGTKQIFPLKKDTLTSKLDLHEAITFMKMKKPFVEHPKLKASIAYEVGTNPLSRVEMVRVWWLFRDDGKILKRMVANFVDLADEAWNGNTAVSSCRDIGKQYIAHFEKLGGMGDLVRMIKSMQYGKRCRERAEASRRYAAEHAATNLTVAHPSQEPQQQSWPLLHRPVYQV